MMLMMFSRCMDDDFFQFAMIRSSARVREDYLEEVVLVVEALLKCN